jgi:hypothetical protein
MIRELSNTVLCIKYILKMIDNKILQLMPPSYVRQSSGFLVRRNISSAGNREGKGMEENGPPCNVCDPPQTISVNHYQIGLLIYRV